SSFRSPPFHGPSSKSGPSAHIDGRSPPALQESKIFFCRSAPGREVLRLRLPFSPNGSTIKPAAAADRGLWKNIRRGNIMTYQEVLEQARGAVGPHCKACPVCNGLACKNSI